MFCAARFARFNAHDLKAPTQVCEYDFTVISVATNPRDNGGEANARSRGLPSVKTKTDLSKSGSRRSHRHFRRLNVAREENFLLSYSARSRAYGDSEARVHDAVLVSIETHRPRRADRVRLF